MPDEGKVNTSLVEEIFRNARFIDSLGIELVEFGFGRCRTRIRKAPQIEQQHGFLHAGVLMTMADHTCGGAAGSTMPDDKDVITVETKVSFLRPASGTEFTCDAIVLRTGKTLVFVEAEVAVERDSARTIVAKASSTLSVIPRHQTQS